MPASPRTELYAHITESALPSMIVARNAGVYVSARSCGETGTSNRCRKTSGPL